MMHLKITMSKKASAAPKSDSEAAVYIKSGKEALWYGEWEKAKYLFEQILKFDAENAAACLGLKLAQTRCKNLDAFIAERKKLIFDKKYAYETLFTFPEAKAKIDSAVSEFSRGDIMTANEIRVAFYPALDIDSRIGILEKITAEEKNFWENDELLSRAQRFAEGELKEKLTKAYMNISDMLNSELKGLREENKSCKFSAEERKTVCFTDIQKIYDGLTSQYSEKLIASYNSAVQMQDSAVSQYGFQNAAKCFRKLGNFKDSALRAEECPKEAAKLIAGQQAEKKAKQRKRITAVTAISGTAAAAIVLYLIIAKLILPAALPPVNYKKGIEALDEGDYRQALCYFDKAGEYSDAAERAMPLRRMFAKHETAAAGFAHTVVIRNDGTVAAAGANIDSWTGQYIGQCDVESWNDIIAVAAGWDHTVGLKADGTVVAVGDNAKGQCNVESWNDIISISAKGSLTMGLKADGTVVAVGDNYFGQCNVEDWRGIIAVAAGDEHTAGLKSDGTVVAVGLKKNTVSRGLKYFQNQVMEPLLTGSSAHKHSGQCDVGSWKDIIAIAAGNEQTVGLKADGTVVATGTNFYGRCNVDDWKNIVAVAAGEFTLIGLKADGTVLTRGWNEYGQRYIHPNNNLAAIAAGVLHTVCIRFDGIAIAAGNNNFGQCNVQDWTDIRLP